MPSLHVAWPAIIVVLCLTLHLERLRQPLICLTVPSKFLGLKGIAPLDQHAVRTVPSDLDLLGRALLQPSLRSGKFSVACLALLLSDEQDASDFSGVDAIGGILLVLSVSAGVRYVWNPFHSVECVFLAMQSPCRTCRFPFPILFSIFMSRHPSHSHGTPTHHHPPSHLAEA